MVGTVARAQCGLLSRWVIVWIAAYALALQSVLAPLLAAPAKVLGAGLNASVSELCIHDNEAAAPAGGGIPAGTHDDGLHCKFCVGCGPGFIVTPQIAMAWAEQAESARVRWAVVDASFADDARFIGKWARGPPLLT